MMGGAVSEGWVGGERREPDGVGHAHPWRTRYRGRWSRKAIVNAVAHRDYTDSSTVQVMLSSDRLEVMNSGGLPPTLTVKKLRVAHQSVPVESAAGRIHVPDALHREDGNGNLGHDPALRRGGPARAGIRGGLGVRDQDLADWPYYRTTARYYPRNLKNYPRNRRYYPRKS